jgi:cortactin
MWKSQVGQNVKVNVAAQDDDWETDSDFVNNVSEKEQRWGSKTVEGSGKPAQAVDLGQLRNKVTTQHEQVAKKEYEAKPGFSYGYGGKFGVQTDRMDKSAVGFDDVTARSVHSSVPKYEKPAVASKPTDLKKKFESHTGAVEPDKIVEARRLREEKDRVDRERIKVEYDAQKAKDLEAAKIEEENKRKELAEKKAKQEEEARIREAAAAARAKARADEEAASRARVEEAKARNDEANARAEEAKARDAASRAEAEERRIKAEEEAELARQAEAEAEAAAETERSAAAANQAQNQYSEYVAEESAAGFGGSGLTATAVYEYEAGGDDELGFNEGDLIVNIEIIDEGWWRGECNGRYGLFPANYVQANQ